MKKKVLIFVGTRPEAIKLLPLYFELKKHGTWQPIIVSTGQHREMLQSVFAFFGVKPNVDLQIMQPDQSLQDLSAVLLHACSLQIKKHQPVLIVVQGDTSTAAMGALASYYARVPVAHVEAGLRSYDKNAPFPEEVNRKIISSVADFHFAPTPLALKNLRSERVEGIAVNVGNTVIDSLLTVVRKLKGKTNRYAKVYQRYFSGADKMILVTGHRRESFGLGFENICNALITLATRFPDVVFVYPVHLNPRVREVVHSRLEGVANIHLLDPVPYDHMVYLMQRSMLILTDSGGIQEEAPALGKPVVVMRDVTERPEGVKAGCSVLVGTSKRQIVKWVAMLLTNKAVYRKMARARNPYGNGTTSRQIASLLAKHILKQKAF